MKINYSFENVEFILGHILWGLVAWIWYKKILFRCLNYHSFIASKLILFGIVALSCGTGIFLEIRKNNKSGLNIFFNLVTGYGIYTVLTYFQIRKMFIVICLSVAGALSAICIILVISRKIRNKNHARRILWKRIIRVTLATQRLVGTSLIFIMVIFGINMLLGSTIMKSRVSTTTQANLSEYSISNKIETIVLLQDEYWESLTVQERLDVLQTVANIEQKYLGLPIELNVGAANLNSGNLGYYSDKTHEIVINMDSLLFDSSWEVLDTVCHESFHSYQYCMIEALNCLDERIKNLKLFQRAHVYAYEFENYINGETDFYNYYYQDCESDARDYAEEAVHEYYKRIQSYLDEKT